MLEDHSWPMVASTVILVVSPTPKRMTGTVVSLKTKEEVVGKAKVRAAEMEKVKAAALVNLLNGEKGFSRALAETAISVPNLLRQRLSLVLTPPHSQIPQQLHQKPV